MTNDMNESFADLLQQTLIGRDIRPGMTVPATVIAVKPEGIVVNTGLKSDTLIPKEEFRGENIQSGDTINVVIEALEDGFGNTRVSREKARRNESWGKLEAAFSGGEIISGTVTERVKGGFTVDINSVRAFLPGSLIDTRSPREAMSLEGKELEFKIIKIDQKRNNIVLSRRAAIEEEMGGERQALLESLQEGQEYIGVVKNITDYGAFVDLGGIDGLLHITDMAWKRVKHPNEVLKVGDEIKVKVLKYDRDKKRVSLGLKQLGEDPWQDIARRHPVGSRLFGRITNITDYGCFVQIEEGIEGLVHMSEMDWTNKNVHPAKLIQPGEEVEVMVLEIDPDRRRISLGIKQCVQNPWEEFAQNHNKGEKIKGNIKSITDFGIFIGLQGNIDGLVHLSDISWGEAGESAIRGYKKGDEVEAVILAIDPERERISLGIKQIENDPFANYLEAHPKGSSVTGEVVQVDPKRAVIDLGDGLQGHLRASEISNEQIKDVQEYIKVGETLTAKLLGLDRKQGIFNLSLKTLNEDTQKEQRSSGNKDTITNPTLGDLLREHVENSKDQEK